MEPQPVPVHAGEQRAVAGPTRRAWPAPTRMPLLLAEAAHVHAWPQTIQCGDRSAGRPDTRSAR
eukprot:3194106-Prymnesium_polylepis.1